MEMSKCSYTTTHREVLLARRINKGFRWKFRRKDRSLSCTRMVYLGYHPNQETRSEEARVLEEALSISRAVARPNLCCSAFYV